MVNGCPSELPPMALQKPWDPPVTEESRPARRLSDFSVDAILQMPSRSPELPPSPHLLPPLLRPYSTSPSSSTYHSPNLTQSYTTPAHHYPLADLNAGLGITTERCWKEDGDATMGYPRKQRTVYHQFQIRKLEEAFLGQQYMVGSDRVALSKKLGLTETQVRVWFQNRRSKWRKEVREHLHSAKSRNPAPPVYPRPPQNSQIAL